MTTWSQHSPFPSTEYKHSSWLSVEDCSLTFPAEVAGQLKFWHSKNYTQNKTRNFQMFKLDLEKAEEPECNCELTWTFFALISNTSKITLKILQARLQQCVNCELPDVQTGLEKAEEQEIKLPTSTRSTKKQGLPEKPLLLLYWLCQSLWLCWSQLWKILEEMGIPDHLTCLLRNLYAGQEATVRTRHGTADWFQIGKGLYQGCTLLPCLFNLYSDNIMQHAGLDKAQVGIKTAGRNINNLRYSYDTTLMA